MSDKMELKSCPFCGGEAELTGFNAPEYWVWCPTCKASTDAHTGMTNAVEAWNTRAWTVADNDAEVLGDVTLGLFRDLMAADPETAKLWARSWPELFGEVVGE